MKKQRENRSKIISYNWMIVLFSKNNIHKGEYLFNKMTIAKNYLSSQ